MEQVAKLDSIKQVFAQKEQHRVEWANLPFLEKIRIVIQMQNTANLFFNARGKRSVVWTCTLK